MKDPEVRLAQTGRVLFTLPYTFGSKTVYIDQIRLTFNRHHWTAYSELSEDQQKRLLGGILRDSERVEQAWEKDQWLAIPAALVIE